MCVPLPPPTRGSDAASDDEEGLYEEGGALTTTDREVALASNSSRDLLSLLVNDRFGRMAVNTSRCRSPRDALLCTRQHFH